MTSTGVQRQVVSTEDGCRISIAWGGSLSHFGVKFDTLAILLL